MIQLFCSKCKAVLIKSENVWSCPEKHLIFKEQDGVIIDQVVDQALDKDFYQDIYNQEKGTAWIQGLNRASWQKRILESMSLSYCRERFFHRYLKGNKNKILDLACGAGRDYLSDYGEVTGIDLIKGPLEIAKKRYTTVVQGDIAKLPFVDNYFDYIVSSDIFGHIRAEDKDAIIAEIYRVLKPGGYTLHVIETDSHNYWFKMAHNRPELFEEYFIKKIGGHVGLELPSQVVVRFQKNGFFVDRAIKIWGLIWPIQDYAGLFDNEYRQTSVFINMVVVVSKWLSRFRWIKILINVILNPINYLVEVCLPLDNGQGLMIVCRKKK